MEKLNRREFIKKSGKVLLVTSSFSVVAIMPGCGKSDSGTKPNYNDGYYYDGYYYDGYYFDGYYYDGYYL